MRDKLFKAWDKTNKEWFMGGDAFDLDFSGSYGSFFFDNDNPCNMRDVELEWVQYTGLTDKNGKEIYEGDIVKVLMTDWASKSDSDPRTIEEYLDDKSELYVIAFHRAEFSMLFKGDEDCPHYMRWGTHGFIKVIGNIYEHKNLLDNN